MSLNGELNMQALSKQIQQAEPSNNNNSVLTNKSQSAGVQQQQNQTQVDPSRSAMGRGFPVQMN